MPLRAFQYCEPLKSASAFGWYVFPPMDFSLKWDGVNITWRPDGATRWKPAGEIVLPGYADDLARLAPPDCASIAPFPFLMSRREPGLIQIWTGLLARTRPGYSLLVRSPANLPRDPGYDVFEGIVETDWWFGPVFSTIRLCFTGTEIHFPAHRPLFQVQPVRTTLHSTNALDDFDVWEGFESLSPSEWQKYRETVAPDEVRIGHYAATVRKRSRKAHGTSE